MLGCPNLMVYHMPDCFDHTVHSIDVVIAYSGGRATIMKFVIEIDTTAFEFCKPVTNSRLVCSQSTYLAATPYRPLGSCVAEGVRCLDLGSSRWILIAGDSVCPRPLAVTTARFTDAGT
ncbi:hypothetical protein EVAR_94216_1 [Eumeta japonica]|uniref:Uncharacterized protein n=1 Tax=Eumeta variegata TaxID=151549 RepID=A0A4C1UPB1_EUMVA|nr:hypothetical protein EVAR_94216_1 [Eumeta japonica]